MNKEQKRYLKEIKALMPVYGKYEKRFFHDIKASICELDAEHITYEMLCLEAGSSRRSDRELLPGNDSTYLRKQLKRTRSIKAVVLIIVLLAVVISLCRLGFLYSLYLDGKDAIITHELVVIE